MPGAAGDAARAAAGDGESAVSESAVSESATSAGGVRIVVVGSLNVDLTFAVDRLPGRGETVLAVAPGQVSSGGKGANQAAAAAAFGAEVTMIGRVGDDEYGRQARQDLAARGIDISLVSVSPRARTGTATIALDPDGDNLIIVDPGANGQLMPADVPGEALSRASAILVQLETPLPTVAAVLRAARAPVVLNPAPAARAARDLVPLADILVPNATELGQLAGAEPPDTVERIVQLARGLGTGRDVIVTLGAAGAVVIPRSGGQVTHIMAPHADVVDATGAGDCFCGTLAVSLARGRALGDAARLSVAAATLSTTAAGPRGRLPDLPEAESLAAGLATRPFPGS